MALPKFTRDIDSMTPEQARILMSAYAPTTAGTTGDYSDLDTFRSYTFTDPNYQYEDFRQLAEIAGFGKEDELASAQNISSGAASDTFRIADPLSMGSNQGALSNLDDGGAASGGSQTTGDEYGFDQYGMPVLLPITGDKQSGGVQLQDPNPTSVGTDYSQLQRGMGNVIAPKGYYYGPADGLHKYGEGPYAEETKAYLDSVGMTFDEFSDPSESSLSEYDQYVEDQDIPIVSDYAVFPDQGSMGGFDIGAGESPSSIPVYVDDDGVVRTSDGSELSAPPTVLQNIKDSAPIPPMQVFGTVGNQFGQADQYTTTTAAMKDIGYTDFSQIERLYYQDKVSGRTYSYDNNDKEFDGLDPGYYGDENVELVGGLYKVKGHDDIKRFDITEEDKKKYDFSGILVSDPETSGEAARIQAKDDPSDNDIFYEYEGRRYVDVTGTGQGIPVGATNIVQGNLGLSQLGAPDVNEEGIITGYSNQTDQGFFTSPVLAKTYEGYVSSPRDPETGEYFAGVGIDTKTPTAGTSFTDSFLTLGEDAKPFDVGQLFGFESGKIVMSNPASNRMNLESFFNNVNSQTFSNYLRGQQDKIDLINRYGLGDLLSGFYGGTKLNPDGSIALDEDGNPINFLSVEGINYMNLDGAFDYTYDKETGKIKSMQLGDNFENVFNEFLSGEDDPQTLANFGDATTGQFAKETGKDDFTKYTDDNGDGDGQNNDDNDGDGKDGDGKDGDGKDGDGNGKNGDNKTPDETEPFVVRAYKGGGVGPFARNYIFQRFGYTPTETIDMLLRYDPVEQLYFFEDGSPVDPEFLQNMQLTKLDDKGQVVRDEDGNAVRMPKVVINNEEEE